MLTCGGHHDRRVRYWKSRSGKTFTNDAAFSLVKRLDHVRRYFEAQSLSNRCIHDTTIKIEA